MSEPCVEKENINKLFDFHNEKMKHLQSMELHQVKIAGDIDHIKTRIDNGMSHTIVEIHTCLAELKPKIEHYGEIVRRIEDLGWWLSKSLGAGILVSVIGIALWAISNGWLPK